jgi:peptidoglycan hydrolase CwlO-like protein
LKSILLQTQTGGLGQVVKMIDRMIAEHHADQADDDSKKDFCNAEFAKTQAAQKQLKGVVGDLQADISHKQDAVDAFASEIATLQQGIADLDKSVVQATQQRRQEHGEYTTTASSNQAALELIRMAKNRMNKFYQPTLYKAPPVTTTGPYGFVQLTLLSRAHARHQTGAHGKSNGVIALLDQIIKDIELNIQESKHDEAVAQRDYERTMKDAATKRLDDSKLMVEKQAAKADEQVELETVTEHLATKNNQLDLAARKLRDLHIDCDQLLQKYEEIKTNRAAEIEGLQQSKSVLQGSEESAAAPAQVEAAPVEAPAEEPASTQSEAALESAMMAPAESVDAASEAAGAAAAAVADAATAAAAGVTGDQ